MARNKYPEQTVKLILDTASRLFMEKGYDGTSLQDIINETNLSKGAIYHHFSSKEEIFERICTMMGEENAARLGKIRDDSSMNGQEKLKAIFGSAVIHPNQEKVVSIVPYLLENPRFLALHLQELFHIVAPEFIKPILDEGVADGSIEAEDTAELAEMILVLTDICLNPLLEPMTAETMRRRCRVFQRLTNAVGLDVIDDQVSEAYVQYVAMKNAPEKK